MLKKGDKIAIVSPSSCIEKNALDLSIAWFRNLGFEVVIMPHVYDAKTYTAGADFDRAEDINRAFADVTVKAIFCSRGGAGATKMLKYLDFDLIKKNHKPIFGLSDSTALQNAVFAKTGVLSYTGFLPVYDFKDGTLDDILSSSLKNIFLDNEQVIKSGKTINSGNCEGILIGGNLSVLCYLCGTQYCPDFKNKILLLEDVGEKTYKIDLMLNQLMQQKNFDKIKGVVFGKFSNCVEVDNSDGSTESIIIDFAKKLNVPAIYDFDYGHIKSRYVLPIGRNVILNATDSELKIPNL